MKYEVAPLSENDKKEVLFLIDKARIKMMNSKLSFFGHILLQLKQDFNGASIGVPTVGVSTDTIYYNLNYLHHNAKNTADMSFIFMHEIMHLVLDHLDLKRIKSRCKKRWNRAGDHVINLDLEDSGFTYSGAAHILRDRKFTNMTTEEVYDLLKEEDEKNGKGKGKGKNIKVTVSDGNGGSQEIELDGEFWEDIIHSDDPEEINKVKEMVINAYNHHVLTNGTNDGIPNSVRNAIEDIQNPILPWNVLLRKFISETSKNDYSWSRLNKNFFPNFYLPTLYDEALSKIDFAIDVSGSIDKETFDKFINEIKNILLLQNITTIGVYQFDTHTLSYDEVTNMNELHDIKFISGGGTCIKDTLKKAAKSDAKALVIITDAYLDLNLEPLNKPTIWCVYNNPNAKIPFGQTVFFDEYL